MADRFTFTLTIDDSVRAAIARACAREALETGDHVTRTAWVRAAIQERLKRSSGYAEHMGSFDE